MANNLNDTGKPNKQKKKRTSIFFRSLEKEGRGVSKNEAVVDYGLRGFFPLYFRRLGTLFSINLLYIFGNFPIMIAMFAASGNVFSTQSLYHQSVLYPAFRGIMAQGLNPVTAALNGVVGIRGVNYVLHTGAYVMQIIGFVLFAITFGLVNVGCAYLIRNIVKGEPIFLFSDFWYAIKRNWKQGLLFGVIDLGICALLYLDIVFWYANSGGFVNSYLFYFSVLLAIFYFVMRYYSYVLMVTFKLKLFKLIKNSAIFAFIGLKRNLMALLGSVIFCALCYGIFYTYVPLGIVLPLVIMIATLAFMGIFAAWPGIRRVMIDPYQKPDEGKDEDQQNEAIFRDDVTERERLEAWKREHYGK